MTENETAKAYELRDLCADDLFPMFNIISKIGIKEFRGVFTSEDVKEAITTANKEGSEGSNAASVGLTVMVDIAGIIVSNIGKCKDDIYQFLSGLSGISKKEIAALPMMTFVNMILDVVKKEEFKDFFQAVSKLFK